MFLFVCLFVLVMVFAVVVLLQKKVSNGIKFESYFTMKIVDWHGLDKTIAQNTLVKKTVLFLYGLKIAVE